MCKSRYFVVPCLTALSVMVSLMLHIGSTGAHQRAAPMMEMDGVFSVHH